MNVGIMASKADFVCLCNNDLVFHRSWATRIIAAFDADRELMSASPYCNFSLPRLGIPKSGAAVTSLGRRALTGWCIFARRSLFDRIGLLDEKFEFWYCDDDYYNTLAANGIKHALVTSAEVDHLGSRTLDALPKKRRNMLTGDQYAHFEYKWIRRSKVRYVAKLLLHRLRAIARTGETEDVSSEGPRR